jgi:hypothetical protein
MISFSLLGKGWFKKGVKIKDRFNEVVKAIKERVE